jgi:hypothetical protein
MKTKALLLLVGASLVTLSFTFLSSEKPVVKEVKKEVSSEPAGGFISEDKF